MISFFFVIGAAEYYKSKKLITRKGSVRKGVGAYVTLKTEAKMICEGSPDDVIYRNIILPTFWNRYEAMNKNKAGCCRNYIAGSLES